MKRQPLLSSERGSALLITLLAVTLLIILGVVLLTIVQQGMKTSTAGESRIIAEALAQKGLDESEATMRALVEASNGLPGYRERAAWLEANIASVLSSLPGDFPAADKRGSYRVEVESAAADLKSTPVGKSEVLPDYPYVRKITVRSTGKVSVVPAVSVTKSMTMYINSINPVMRYALSANVDEANLALPLYDPARVALALNGAVYVVGNMYMQGDLQVRDYAKFRKQPGVEDSVATLLPALRGFYKTTGQVIKPAGAAFSPGSLPLEDNTLEQAERVDVSSTVASIMAKYTGPASQLGAFPPELIELPEVILSGESEGWKHFEQAWVQVESDAVIQKPASASSADVLLTNSLLSMEPDSSLTIHGGSLAVDYPDPDIVVAHLEGELALDEDQLLAVRGNAVISDGFQLKSGSLFVQGDLKIYGDVHLYGTVYVDGNVELRDIKSVNGSCSGTAQTTPEAECSPLIIAASGTIELGEYIHEEETRVNAYLYAGKSIKLYGVYSRLNIVGGLHADEGLELNAIRGALIPIMGKTELDPVWERYSIQHQSSLNAEDSRLRVMHDINLYEAPPAGIPLSELFNLYVTEAAYLRH